MSVLERLKAAGVNLPEPRAPVANYVPFVITGNRDLPDHGNP